MSPPRELRYRATIRIPKAGTFQDLTGSFVIRRLVQRLSDDQGAASRCRYVLPPLSDAEAALRAFTCLSEVASRHALLCGPQSLVERLSPRSDRQENSCPLFPRERARAERHQLLEYRIYLPMIRELADRRGNLA